MNDEFRTVHLNTEDWQWLKNERLVKRPLGEVETMAEAFHRVRMEVEHKRVRKEAD